MRTIIEEKKTTCVGEPARREQILFSDVPSMRVTSARNVFGSAILLGERAQFGTSDLSAALVVCWGIVNAR